MLSYDWISLWKCSVQTYNAERAVIELPHLLTPAWFKLEFYRLFSQQQVRKKFQFSHVSPPEMTFVFTGVADCILSASGNIVLLAWVPNWQQTHNIWPQCHMIKEIQQAVSFFFFFFFFFVEALKTFVSLSLNIHSHTMINVKGTSKKKKQVFQALMIKRYGFGRNSYLLSGRDLDETQLLCLSNMKPQQAAS